MLELKVHDGDREVVLRFEHSLLSLSKWESIHKKPFMSRVAKTPTEMMAYFRCMLLDSDVDPDMIYALEPAQLDAVAEYINEEQTATVIPREQTRKFNPEVTTSELIYYWMVALKINWDAQTWHLSRLLALIELVSFKSQPEDKRRKSRPSMGEWNEINQRQRRMFGSKG